MANSQKNSKISNLSDISSRPTNIDFGCKAVPENAAGDFKTLQETGAIEEDDIKLLKDKYKELEIRYKSLLFENQQINLDFNHEKHKVLQLERQLTFLKDNETIFEKLRDACVTVKCKNTSGRKLVEIRDKSVQTWEGVLCRACLDTEKLRRQMEQLQAKYKECIMVKREEIDKINATVQTLKGFVQNKEDECSETFVTSEIDEAKLENKKSELKINYKNLWRSQSVDRHFTGSVKSNCIRKSKCKLTKSSALLRQVTECKSVI